jgi:hypothetical protein
MGLNTRGCERKFKSALHPNNAIFKTLTNIKPKHYTVNERSQHLSDNSMQTNQEVSKSYFWYASVPNTSEANIEKVQKDTNI